MDICYENNHAIIEHNTNQQALTITWQGFVKEEDFRLTLTKFYDLSLEKHIEKWCVDSREQGLIAKEDQKWAAKEILRRKFHKRPLKTAMIISDNAFMAYSVKNIVQSICIRTGYRITSNDYGTFKTKEDGLEWLYS